MRELLLVGSGSFIGGVGRYYLSTIIAQTLLCMRFPIGTLLVNITGCFLIGAIAELIDSQNIRLFLMAGVLGGFTTFSAFGYETVTLLKAGEITIALLYVFVTVMICLIAVWIGLHVRLCAGSYS